MRLVVLGVALALAGCYASGAQPSVGSAPGRSGYAVPSLFDGDLVFLDLDCPLCQAIEEVTRQQFQVSGPALSHVGLIERDDQGGLWVLEAWPAATAGQRGGIQRTALKTFLARVKGGSHAPGGYYWGRLRSPWRQLGLRARQAAQAMRGQPYDEDFLVDNGRLYCAELIYEAFKAAHASQPFFRLQPMYFGQADRPERQTWETYYRERHHPVPEGQPGLSPLGIYLQGHAEQRFIP